MVSNSKSNVGVRPQNIFLRQRPLEHLPLSTDNYYFTPLSGSEETTTSIKIDTYQNFHDMNKFKQSFPCGPSVILFNFGKHFAPISASFPFFLFTFIVFSQVSQRCFFPIFPCVKLSCLLCDSFYTPRLGNHIAFRT